MRANSKQREPELQRFWEEQNIYEQLLQNNPGVGCSPTPIFPCPDGMVMPMHAELWATSDLLRSVCRKSLPCMMGRHMLTGEKSLLLCMAS